MRIIHSVFALFALLMIVSCTPSIDGSSEEKPEVLQIDGPDGEALYSTLEFGAEEAERLHTLLENYPEFQQ